MRYLRALATAVVVLSTAVAWTLPERVDRKPDGYRTYLPVLAAGPDGTLHAAWSESPGTGFLQKIMYATRQGDTWTIPVNISRDSGDIRTPAIVLDSTGHALVVWSEESYARMRYVRQLDDSWSVPKLCFSNLGIMPRLVVNGQGRIHLLFEDLGGQGAIRHSRYDAGGDSWETPDLVADDSGTLAWSDLAVDSRDRLHAVWMDYGTYGMGYCHNDGAGWTRPEQLPDPAPSGQSVLPRIAVDTADSPHVVWEERSGGYLVHYTFRDGDTWATPYRVYDESGSWPVLAIDPAGRVHVVWGWSYGLKYVAKTESGWSAPLSVTNAGTAAPGQLLVRGSMLSLVLFQGQWEIWYSEHDASGVEGDPGCLPERSRLRVGLRAGEVVASFRLESSCRVTLQVLDSAGRQVAGLGPVGLDEGPHEVSVPVTGLASGTYLCRAVMGGKVESVKLVVTR